MTAEKRIRLMVVDDHPVVRRGIALLLSTEPDLELVAEAENGREAIHQFRTHRPDVTLMDLQMPEMGGVDALSAIRAEFPDARTEIRVLQLIAQGKANKEIARALSTSEATVKWQVRTILSKLGVQDRTHAAMIGLKRGIIVL